MTAPARAPDIALNELLDAAGEAVRAGSERALSWWGRADEISVEEKLASDDLVSQADRDSEQAIRACLRRLRPEDEVLGEEDGRTPGTSGIVWVVDPIDGTTSYLYGRSDWAVSVAALRASDRRILAGAVAEPALDRLTAARLGGGTWMGGARVSCAQAHELGRALVEVNLGRPEQRPRAGRMIDVLVPNVRDVRRGGSAAAALAHVAGGRAEAYWGPGLQPWDAAAGLLLVSEAGGAVGDLAGPSSGIWPASGNVLASVPGLFEPLRALLRTAYAEG
jgi:myo-inositol-1(or 4)-monophosphatase